MLNIEKKFGYYRAYTLDNNFVEASSKLEALEIAKRFNRHITYHFNDDEFSEFDWSQPVQESINELYCHRAQQLRDKYDHVVLLYSGGYDSDNILKTFIKNNIHIDCIVSMYHHLDEDGPSKSTLNVEWDVQTWPKLQKILPSIPSTKIAKISISDLVLNFVDQYYKDYQYKSPGMVAPNNGARSFIRYKLDKKYHESNTCIVYGVDKPRLRYKDKKFIFNFLDNIGRNNSPIIPNSGYEWFYWSPDFPKLVIKQAQLVKQYWQFNFDNLLNHPKNRFNHNLGIMLDCKHPPVQQLIYPECCDSLYLSFPPSTQPIASIVGNRDRWIFNSNTEYRDKLKKIIDNYQTYPKEWCNNQDPNQGLIGSLSKDYIL